MENFIDKNNLKITNTGDYTTSDHTITNKETTSTTSTTLNYPYNVMSTNNKNCSYCIHSSVCKFKEKFLKIYKNFNTQEDFIEMTCKYFNGYNISFGTNFQNVSGTKCDNSYDNSNQVTTAKTSKDPYIKVEW